MIFVDFGLLRSPHLLKERWRHTDNSWNDGKFWQSFLSNFHKRFFIFFHVFYVLAFLFLSERLLHLWVLCRRLRVVWSTVAVEPATLVQYTCRLYCLLSFKVVFRSLVSCGRQFTLHSCLIFHYTSNKAYQPRRQTASKGECPRRQKRTGKMSVGEIVRGGVSRGNVLHSLGHIINSGLTDDTDIMKH